MYFGKLHFWSRLLLQVRLSQSKLKQSCIAWNFLGLEILFLVIFSNKITVLRQEWNFFTFSFTTVAKRSLFNVARFLDPSLCCDELKLYHVKSSRLVPAKKNY